MSMHWKVTVVQRHGAIAYAAQDLPIRQPFSIREHVEAHELGLPVDHQAAMQLLEADHARHGRLNDEGIVLLAAAMHWGADRAKVAKLFSGPQWLETYSQRVQCLPDSDFGHTFVLRDDRVAVADDQAMAHAALKAMGELTMGVLTINDSHGVKLRALSQAKHFDQLAASLKADFQVSFKNADGTYAEALDDLGRVVSTPADPHTWWMVRGIGNDGQVVNPTPALRRWVNGEERDAGRALVALRLLHDLDVQPSKPQNHMGYDGRLPKGIKQVVVQGLMIDFKSHELTLTDEGSHTASRVDVPSGYTSMLASDNNAGRTRVAPRHDAAVDTIGVSLPAQTSEPSPARACLIGL